MKEVANLSILTASAENRTSFGCDSGSDQTYFGSIFNKELDAMPRPKSLRVVDWSGLYGSVARKIKWKERLTGHIPSYPRYQSNVVLVE